MRLRPAAPAVLAIVAIVATARPSGAQSWAPRVGEGDVTFVVQSIDHLGRVFPDSRFPCCETTNVALAVDADYGLSSRWSMSAGVPYVFAQYWGRAGEAAPPPWYTTPAVDACRCLHSAFQDFNFGAHYNLVRVHHSFSLMTSVTTNIPSHSYPYVGEAVVGFDLKELGFSVDAGQQIHFLLPGLSVEGNYAYTVVERVLGISHNRSNFALDTGYALPHRLAGHVILAWQQTYGGVTVAPDAIAGHPELYTEFHRLLRDDYFHAGAGASYTWRDWDLSFSFLRTVSGDNTHNVHVFTLTSGRSFRLRR